MSTYYGAYMTEPTSRKVLCHTIRIEEYTRTLPNGKTITVRGYSRQGNAASDIVPVKANRRRVNREYDKAASEHVRAGNVYARGAVSSIRSNARNAVDYAGRAVSRYGQAAGVKVRQGLYNAGNAISDFAKDFPENAQMGIGNFIEQVRYGAAYAGAAASEAAKKVAAAAKKAYDAGKNFIERLFNKVKGIVNDVKDFVNDKNLVRTDATIKATTAIKNKLGLNNSQHPNWHKDTAKRRTTNGRAGGGGTNRMSSR